MALLFTIYILIFIFLFLFHPLPPPLLLRQRRKKKKEKRKETTITCGKPNPQIWKSLKVPLGPRRVPKHEGQELLHAVEELYFFRRFEEAVSFVGKVFEGEGGGDGLDTDVRDTLRTYERKCLGKLGR